MKQFINLIITCKFSDFVRGYTGLNDSEECMAFIEEQDRMWFVDSQSNGEFLTEADMIAIWDSRVEVRIEDQMNNGVYILNLTVYIPDDNVFKAYNESIIECNCTDLERMLHNIIKHNF